VLLRSQAGPVDVFLIQQHAGAAAAAAAAAGDCAAAGASASEAVGVQTATVLCEGADGLVAKRPSVVPEAAQCADAAGAHQDCASRMAPAHDGEAVRPHCPAVSLVDTATSPLRFGCVSGGAGAAGGGVGPSCMSSQRPAVAVQAVTSGEVALTPSGVGVGSLATGAGCASGLCQPSVGAVPATTGAGVAGLPADHDLLLNHMPRIKTDKKSPAQPLPDQLAAGCGAPAPAACGGAAGPMLQRQPGLTQQPGMAAQRQQDVANCGSMSGRADATLASTQQAMACSMACDTPGAALAAVLAGGCGVLRLALCFAEHGFNALLYSWSVLRCRLPLYPFPS
jgi:hypothetical protein